MDIMTDVDIHFEDKKESRFFFLFLCIMYALVYMTKNCFSSAMASIVHEGVLTKSQTGLITAAFYFVYTPLQVAGGVFADRYNPERMIKIGLIGSAISNIVIFFCQNYYVMLISWVFSAIIQFPLWPSVFKIISSQLCRSDRPYMIFYISLTNSLGLVFGYIVAAFIPKWQYNFAFSAFVLLFLAVGLHLLCKHFNAYIKPDCKEEKNKSNISVETENISTIKLFMKSGFFIVVFVTIIRCIVEQGIKTLSPTMIMETYSNISPTVGNLLNVFVIISGIIGTVLVKMVLYPKYIKNEINGILIMLLLALPFSVIIDFIGKNSVMVSIASLCGMSITLTSTNLLTSYYNMHFIKWGKNGTAAGIINSAASLGVMLQSYGLVYVAELWGWMAVVKIWIIMIVVSVICIAVAAPMAKRFKKML